MEFFLFIIYIIALILWEVIPYIFEFICALVCGIFGTILIHLKKRRDKNKIEKTRNSIQTNVNKRIVNAENENTIAKQIDTVNEEDLEVIQEYYCERCFKRISKEDYEIYECMCEDCYTDVNFYGEKF